MARNCTDLFKVGVTRAYVRLHVAINIFRTHQLKLDVYRKARQSNQLISFAAFGKGVQLISGFEQLGKVNRESGSV